MKILLLDIETAPNKVYAWGLWDQNIAINQIEEPGYTICWAAQWYGEKDILYASVHEQGRRKMLQRIYSLIDEADVVVHFNGTKFDIPTLNKEFVLMGWPPPSPILEVDLYLAVKKRFKFPSNKLSYIAGQLGLGDKVEHKGMDLWRDCMAGDKKAWELMKRYNKQDVALLHGLYEIIKPWLPRHPNFNVYDDVEKPRCPICGSTHIQKRGKIHTRSQAYQRYYCNDCNGWSRERTSLLTKEKRKSVLVGAV